MMQIPYHSLLGNARCFAESAFFQCHAEMVFVMHVHEDHSWCSATELLERQRHPPLAHIFARRHGFIDADQSIRSEIRNTHSNDKDFLKTSVVTGLCEIDHPRQIR